MGARPSPAAQDVNGPHHTLVEALSSTACLRADSKCLTSSSAPMGAERGERVERYDPETQWSDALMYENACATYAHCLHAGEPMGSFALWTPGQEHAWCR